jgi:hypothetical protein
MSRLLLAEELALLARNPRTHRRPFGSRDVLNACLAGLLLAELQLADRPTQSPTLTAVSGVADETGPKLRSILSAMDRRLDRRTGHGTWDLVTAGLADVDASTRDEIIERLRHAATGTGPLDIRIALLLSFSGPARLLEMVAPRRRSRRHARRRIDHALDATPFQTIRAEVRGLIATQDAAGAVAVAGAVAASCG